MKIESEVLWAKSEKGSFAGGVNLDNQNWKTFCKFWPAKKAFIDSHFGTLKINWGFVKNQKKGLITSRPVFLYQMVFLKHEKIGVFWLLDKICALSTSSH